jgi:antitoxin FitA
MATIQIRDVPEHVYETLQADAKAAGQSLQAYMRELVVSIAEFERRKRAALGRIEQRLAREGGPGLSTDEILDARDADRR